MKPDFTAEIGITRKLIILFVILFSGGLSYSYAVDNGNLSVFNLQFNYKGRTDEVKGSGFIARNNKDEVFILTCAHNVDYKTGVLKEVILKTPYGNKPAGKSNRALSSSGRPYNMPGGAYLTDYILFLLEVNPSGAAELKIDERELPDKMEEVNIIYANKSKTAQNNSLPGEVQIATPNYLGIRVLTQNFDASYLDGSPVVSKKTLAVVGMVVKSNMVQNKRLEVFAVPASAFRGSINDTKAVKSNFADFFSKK